MPPATDHTHFATVFGLHDDPGRSAAARLELSPAGITVEADGLPPRVLSHDEIEPLLGGTEGDHLVLRVGDPARDGLLIYVDDDATRSALLGIASPRLRERLLRVDARRQAQDRRVWLKWTASAAVAAAVGWAAWAAFGIAADAAVARIPPKWEVELGRHAAKSALADKEMVRDPTVSEATQRLTDRLLAALPRQPYEFRVQVVRESEVNAFALPGGQIIVYTGLIAAAETPEELAGVLAHEMHHVLRRHGMKRIVRSVGMVAIAQTLLGNSAGLLALLRDRAPQLLSLKFDRRQELEADAGALQTLTAARVSPQGMLAFFGRLSRREGTLANALAFASTHPTSKQRIERLSRAITKAPTWEAAPLKLDWGEVRQRCQREQDQPLPPQVKL
jgi:predicted Zn-dependent protease